VADLKVLRLHGVLKPTFLNAVNQQSLGTNERLVLYDNNAQDDITCSEVMS
jgi:hypothetical protein